MPFDFKRLAIPEVLLITPARPRRQQGVLHGDLQALGVRGGGHRARSSCRRIIRARRAACCAACTFSGRHRRRASSFGSSAGRIFDVAVDLRPDSPTRGKWVGVELSADDRKMMYIPAWCAHGFCVLSERAEVVYHTSTEYSPEHESGVMWNDPALGITWPSPIRSCRTGTDSWPPCCAGVR